MTNSLSGNLRSAYAHARQESQYFSICEVFKGAILVYVDNMLKCIKFSGEKHMIWKYKTYENIFHDAIKIYTIFQRYIQDIC